MEDSSILELIWQRAEPALCAMSQKYGPRLYRTAINILSSHEDAEESVNDTYLAVWDAIPPTRPTCLSGFVYKTGRNIALKRLRYETAQRRRSEFDLSLDELSSCIAGDRMEQTVEVRALAQTIDVFLDMLPKLSRVLFLRRYWFGDSVHEISAAFHMSPGTVSVRLHRVREALKAHLIKEGYYYE